MPGKGDPPKEHQFQQGKSGNPKGRPRGVFSLTEEMRRWLNRTDEESGRKNGEIFIENAMIAASEGNGEWIKQVMNRLEGPVPSESKIDVTSAGKPLGVAMLTGLSDDDLKRIASGGE